ncbi:fimbria/pilus outer membrane usher protein [Cupriavidus sp. 30B13]|uniref:fimbria/pilus outer membrane usher protein n=1 Tax=Cupriavidus sp. 30B13 TaxID=3384241 RepID=UPI003CE7315D
MMLAAAGAARPGGAAPAAATGEAPCALPPAGAAMRAATLYLELVVNELPSGRVAPVLQRDGAYFLCAADLAGVSVRADAAAGELVNPATLAGVRVEYRGAEQQLGLTVPPAWLPRQPVGQARQRRHAPAAVSPGMLLNYDVYASAAASAGAPPAVSAWSEQRMFGGWGSAANTGVYRHGGAGAAGGYLRYDTAWTYSDQDRMHTYQAGDLVTGALAWNSAVRLGDIAVSRNFRVRPDLVTYPLPEFSGLAAVPSAVDLFINGSRAATGHVNPGPFTLGNVPFINGAGEATVVTTDALGRQVSATIPFYAASTLLKAGLSDYALAAGAMRRHYGSRSLAYGKPAAAATLRRGITDSLTVEGHAEAGKGLALGGLGAGVGIGMLGTVDLAAAFSRLDGRAGQQYALGHGYASPRFSVGVQHIRRSAGYGDLSAYDRPAGSGHHMARGSTQATAALHFGGGTLGAGYVDVRASGGTHARIANLSYTRALSGGATLFAAINKTIAGRGVAAQLQVVVPLGAKGTVTGSLAHERGGASQRVQYSRAVPSDGGLGWNLAYAGGAARYQQADLAWRNRYFQVQGGVYGGGGQAHARWGEAQGSLVLMNGAVLPANRIDDAFVLVDTQGHPGVPVRYENQVAGETDSRGHLLVPWAPSYYAAKYEIDPLGLPDDVRVPVLERHVAVRGRAGALVTFPVEKVVSARIRLVDGAGAPLRPGARVTHRESGQTALVGWGGETYLEGLALRNHLRVTRADGSRCAATFSIPPGAGRIHQVGPLACGE